MSPHRLLIALLSAFAVLTFACGDDDGDGGATKSPTATARTTTPDNDDETVTPTSGDEKTPGADETPGNSAAPTDTGPTRTPAAEGTPAVQPLDTPAFLQQFANEEINYSDCVFNPATAVTDCPGYAKYAVNPPLSGQDISCQIGIVKGTAELIRCTSQEPLTTIYYDIQG